MTPAAPATLTTHPGPRIGGLFEGYGGLTEGIKAVMGGELVWYSEFDGLPTAKKPHLTGACRILAHRYPGVPNHGDITLIDWAAVEPVDVLCGGSPCQDLSHAGRRAGMTEGTRSNLWVAMREAIAQLRPRVVVWENVRGAFSAAADSDLEFCPGCMGSPEHRGAALRALGRVLGDLSDLGYDASWHSLRAADVGAPHGRFRVFVVATDTTRNPGWISDGDDGAAALARRVRGRAWWAAGPGEAAGWGALGDPAGRGNEPLTTALFGTPRAADGIAHPLREADAVTAAGGAHSRLEDQVALMGTPTARMWKGSGPVGSDSHTWLLDHGNVEAQVLLLPTPAVNDMGACHDPETWDAWTDRMKAEHGNGNGHGKSLAIEAQRLHDESRCVDCGCPEHLHDEGGFCAGRCGGEMCGGRQFVQRLLPTPRASDGEKGGPNQRGSSGDLMLPAAVQPARLLPTPTAKSAEGSQTHRSGDRTDELLLDGVVQAAANGKLLPTPVVTDAKGARNSTSGRKEGSTHAVGDTLGDLVFDGRLPTDAEGRLLPTPTVRLDRWGDYAPAIARWETILGRPAPDPTTTSTKGNAQLAARFVEWMMGLPDGWVTDVPGTTRNEALKALGNGVCPQQAASALWTIAGWED